jgi:outer membrane murein-binding lipoprotein Lpp
MALPAPASRPSLRATVSIGLLALGGAWILSGCQSTDLKAEVNQLKQRQEQLDLKIQQLEQKLHSVTPRDPEDRPTKAPAGPVRSITYRSGTDDDRLRIYWADGSSSDLPCTQEQATLVCG